MADDTDFASLYRELGIRAACSPDAFRQAYRRRVSQLHPDQRGSADDVARLQELNRLYDAALDFLHAHGRLPGALAPATQAPSESAQAVQPPRSSAPGRNTPLPDPEVAALHEEGVGPAGNWPLSRYFILLAVLAIVALVVSALKGMMSVGQEVRSAGDAGVPLAASGTMPTAIALGMEKERVKAIQGAPVGSHDIRWDYGPSWIDFRCGGVVTDWYSSPLRPLHTPTPHPTPRDWDVFDAARPPGC